MKKLFLSLAFVLMSSFVFATTVDQSTVSNDIVKTVDGVSFDSKFVKDESFGTCTVIVRFYNSDGEVTGTRIHTFYNVATESDCESWATAVSLHYSIQ